MKKVFLVIAIALMMVGQAKAQEVANEIKRISKAVVDDPKQDVQVRRVAYFKVNAVDYMKMKIRDIMANNPKDKEAINKNIKMVNEQYTRAKNILMEHKEGHNALAELLIQKEVIMAEDVEKIFGKRPWMSRSQEIMEDEQPKIDDTVKELPEVQAAIKEHEENNKNAEEKQDDSRAEDKQDKSHAEDKQDDNN